jgi:hypothetical protein
MSLSSTQMTIATCGCLCLALVSGVCAADNAASGDKWRAWVELGAYAANKHPGAQRDEGAFWAPLLQGHAALLFADVHGKFFDEDQHEGNAAIGYREMLQSGWNLGV